LFFCLMWLHNPDISIYVTVRRYKEPIFASRKLILELSWNLHLATD
jgi:hypothetical protein